MWIEWCWPILQLIRRRRLSKVLLEFEEQKSEQLFSTPSMEREYQDLVEFNLETKRNIFLGSDLTKFPMDAGSFSQRTQCTQELEQSYVNYKTLLGTWYHKSRLFTRKRKRSSSFSTSSVEVSIDLRHFSP